MKIIKNILLFTVIYLLWSIGGLIFKIDTSYYNSLNLPNFILPNNLIAIIWIILYLLITISIFIIIKDNKFYINSDYFYVLITNYIANELFIYAFFTLKSPFLGFTLTTITFISSIFMLLETRLLNKKGAYLLLPYCIFNIYATVLSMSIYFLNL
jgi:translocator protein